MYHELKGQRKERFMGQFLGFQRSFRKCFRNKEISLITMMILMTVLVQQCFNNNVEAKTLQHYKNSKKTLKLLQSSSSFIRVRPKRDAFANDYQQQQEQHSPGMEPFVKDNIKYYENLDAAEEDSEYYDDNYDVIPNVFGNSSPPSFQDQISKKAKEVADSFANMWQSLGDSVRHCLEALRGLFTDAIIEDEENLTPEQQQQQQQFDIFDAMEQQFRSQKEHDNEVLNSIFENKA